MIRKKIPARVEGLESEKGLSKNYYQPIINLIRPHDTLIVPFLGNSTIVQHMKPSKRTIANDINMRVIDKWKKMQYSWMELWNADYIEFLQTLDFTSLGKVVLLIDPPGILEEGFYATYPLSDNQHEQLLDFLCALPKDVDIVVTVKKSNRLYENRLSHFHSRMYTYNTGNMRKEVNQWIFCNYDLSLTKLHDYSFVGDSSFEKFRIRTKGEKLADKILKEKPLFQQAILDMINQKVVQKDAERKDQETHTIELGKQWYENREQ